MQNDHFRILEIFYNRLKSVIEIANRTLPQKSILLSFFEMKKNARYRFLSSVELPVGSVSGSVIQSLLDEHFITPGEELDHYRITAKGIWVVELKNEVLDIEKLTNYINTKFFTFEKHSNALSDRQKIVVLLFLALRAFSSEACIDLKQGDTVLDNLQDVAVKCFHYLESIGKINSLKSDEIFGEDGNEHQVSNLIRHTDRLPRKTKGMFTALGQQKYFLNVSEKGELDSHKIAFLIATVLDKEYLPDDEEKLKSFLEDINLDRSIYIYSAGVTSFSSPIYDSSMREAVSEAISR